MTKLNSLQVLRAIAALVVVLVHLTDIELKHGGGSTLLGTWTKTGGWGVDLFFVLSGFVMVIVTTNYDNSLRQSLAFLGNRITRIYPLWWACFGALAVLWLLKPEMVFGGSSDPNLLKDALLIWDGKAPLLQTGWTLIHEMYFYAAFSLILLLPIGHFKRARVLLAWGAIVVVGANLVKPGPSTYLHVILHPMTLEFIAGAMAAYAWQISKGKFAGLSLALGSVILIAGTFAFHAHFVEIPSETSGHFTDWHRTFWFGPSGALIVYGFVGLESRGALKFSGLPVKIGDWSYSLYLTHMLTLGVAGIVWKQFSRPGLIDNFIAIPLIVVTCIAVSWLSYTIVEQPSMIFSRKYIGRVANARGRTLQSYMRTLITKQRYLPR